MKIEAKIIADSVNVVGNRITTFVCVYPRFIHSEILTHRLFSRNAASSRAIPIKKMIDMVRENPAMPMHWGKNQKGMQATEQIEDVASAQKVWLDAMEQAIKHAEMLTTQGVHKQVVNRLLEPFVHMTTIITATEFGNFFNLRAHKDAQPEFQELAFQMLNAYANNPPVFKKPGEWHIPFGDQFIDEELTVQQKLKIATARAARVSYLTFDGNIDHEKDYVLHDLLRNDGHLSPFEHSACALSSSEASGNLRGWQQYRKLFTDEHKQQIDINKLIKDKNAS